MARAGRPRKLGHRYKCGCLFKEESYNGKLQIRMQKIEEQQKDVLSQPHRKGNLDQRCGDALGRYCIKCGLDNDIYTAGDQYRNLITKWRVLVGVPINSNRSAQPSPVRVLTDDEITEIVKNLKNKIDKIDNSIKMRSGEIGLNQLKSLILDDVDCNNSRILLAALTEMARGFGYFSKPNHPFH